MKRTGIILCLLLAACSGGTPGVVEIEFWAIGREGEVVREMIPDFERSHPGIRVRVQQIPWTAAHEKLLTAYAGDAVPDLCQLGNTWIPEFVALDALEPLGPWVARSTVIDAAAYFPGIWDTNVMDAVVYGIPWYVDTRLLFYRRDLLAAVGYDEPPETWAGWTDALRRIKQRVGADRYAVLLPTNEFEPQIVLALQQEGGMLREDGRYGNFNSDDFRRAFTFYVDMFENGWAPRFSNTQISNIWQEFGRGFFSFYITGPWNIGEFRRRLPDSLQGAWMTAAMPGPDGPGASTAGGASLVLFEASEKKEAAWAFIEYLSAPEQQIRFHELTGNLPAREDAWEDPALTGNAYAAAFRDQLRRVRPTPKVPEWERIATKIREYSERVVNGQMSVDQALEGLDRDVDRLLEKRRWMLGRQEERP